MDSLKNIRYPGRFIILGKDGEDFVTIYGVTGRSASSLARRYVQENNEILAVQTAEGGNPELLTYPAFRFFDNGIAVANGRQIQNISTLTQLTAKEQLLRDLANEEYEPDDNKTPRITGCYIENGSDTTAGLHIVRSMNGKSEKSAWDVPLTSGKGAYISTYSGIDTKIAPSFIGEPILIDISFGSPEKAARAVFDIFSPQGAESDYRISIIACYKKLGEAPRVSILNKLDIDPPQPILLWDFDQTLTHKDGKSWSYIIHSLLIENGINTVSLDEVKVHMREGYPWHSPELSHDEFFAGREWWEHMTSTFAGAIQKMGVEQDLANKIAKQIKQRYLKSKFHIYEDTIPCLKMAVEKGYKNYILSNHVPELPMLVKELGLEKYFEKVFSSAHIGYEKPNKEFYKKVLAEIGSSAHITMIGDNYTADVEGALAVGIDAILVRAENTHNYPKYSPSLMGIFNLLKTDKI